MHIAEAANKLFLSFASTVRRADMPVIAKILRQKFAKPQFFLIFRFEGLSLRVEI